MLMNTNCSAICVAVIVGAVAVGYLAKFQAYALHDLAVGALIVCLFIVPVQRLKLIYWHLKRKKCSVIPDHVDKAMYVAMDCEMVGVGPNGRKSALARVSIVDWDLKVIFDTYVQVMDRVTDYRTHVSGIRKKNLKGPNAMNFRKCRETVAGLLQDKVVVGHGLENDFQALRLIHQNERIRDTTLYRPLQRFDGGKFRSRKLRELVTSYLGTADFQQGEHDSIHDAQAAMALYHTFYHEWEQSLVNISDD